MAGKTARLFTNGGSQAVRLPAEFRFSGADEAHVRRDAVTGDVILSEKPVDDADWAGFFALRDSVESRHDLRTPIGSMDAMIAGHALALDAVLVTNNVRHFSRIPRLRMENWAGAER